MEVRLFGSYLKNKNTANDIDIAIITKYLEGSSGCGRLIVRIIHPLIQVFFRKRIDIAIYSRKYLDEREKQELIYGQRRKGVFLKQSILLGKKLI